MGKRPLLPVPPLRKGLGLGDCACSGLREEWTDHPKAGKGGAPTEAKLPACKSDCCRTTNTRTSEPSACVDYFKAGYRQVGCGMCRQEPRLSTSYEPNIAKAAATCVGKRQ
jgi:hypothetical protein